MPTKHTPGPWAVRPEATDNGDESLDYFQIETKDCAIARGVLIDADAALIAAAPDLLDALQILLAARQSETLHMATHWSPAQAAVAKATGNTKGE